MCLTASASQAAPEAGPLQTDHKAPVCPTGVREHLFGRGWTVGARASLPFEAGRQGLKRAHSAQPGLGHERVPGGRRMDAIGRPESQLSPG